MTLFKLQLKFGSLLIEAGSAAKDRRKTKTVSVRVYFRLTTNPTQLPVAKMQVASKF